ncbi:hypothetical protein [Sphingomonas segetis]|jgi:hypothetical protein|nr:hypothetical protein [Sphingomonas segetis]
MRKKRERESDERRGERTEKEAVQRVERSAAEDRALDAAVRQSIKLHGA